MKKCFLLTPGIFLILFLFPLRSSAARWDGVVTTINDGDTITVSADSKSFTADLYGIDAPELGQDFSRDAKHFLSERLLNKRIKLKFKRTEAGRRAEVFYLSGNMRCANQELLKAGLAWSNCRQYTYLETLARKKQLGIWSANNPTSPKEYRRYAAKRKKALQERKNATKNKAFEQEFYKDFYAGVRYGQDAEAGDKDPGAQGNIKTNSNLKDIDVISLRAAFDGFSANDDTVLEIWIDYKSTQLGKDILWEKGKITCDCDVKAYFSDGKHTEWNRIATERRQLTSRQDNILIEIPRNQLSKRDTKRFRGGKVICEFNTGHQRITAYDRF